MQKNIIHNEQLVEYILYITEQHSHKDWGHIWGWTTNFAYYKTTMPSSANQDMPDLLTSNFQDQTEEYTKMIVEWYQSDFQRDVLYKYDFSDYLYDFLIAISWTQERKFDYYFRFSEELDTVSLKYLLLSVQKNKNYLFSFLALASYYSHNKRDFKRSYTFYNRSLEIDPFNPHIIARFALVHMYMNNLDVAEELIQKAIAEEPSLPFSYSWHGDILNAQGRFYDALEQFEVYEKITIGKYRTFEPFLGKAESYLGLGDFKKAAYELEKIDEYYFGEGYRDRYTEVVTICEKMSQYFKGI